ncbi:hypothetical protein INR49_008803 [Caranx melampygus]|nr:hypothetical protein INR49_008803 [Caranx melampygus]
MLTLHYSFKQGQRKSPAASRSKVKVIQRALDTGPHGLPQKNEGRGDKIYGNLSGFIGRAFAGKQEQTSCSPSDRTKFLLWGNSLNITKVTADDCRLYYCAKKNNSNIHYLDTFQLVTDVPPPPPPPPSRGSDSGRQEEQGSGSLLHSVPVLYGFLALSGLLMLVTTGVACVSLYSKKKKSRDFQVDEPPPVTYETPQYEEIQFSSSVGPAAAAPECIYYKAQLPIYGNLSGFIGRAFSGKQEQTSCSPSDRTKFLLWGNSLNITKVTADDCRRYYCAKKNNSNIHYLDTFQLVTDVPPPPPPPPPPPSRGSDSGQQEEQGSGSLLHSVPVLYGSLALNGLLILVTTGVACVSLYSKKKKSRDFQVDEPPPVTYETPQYEEIQFSSSVGPAAAAPECIYYKAQLPVCTLPPP